MFGHCGPTRRLASTLLSRSQPAGVGEAEKAQSMTTARFQTGFSVSIAAVVLMACLWHTIDCRAEEWNCRCRDSVCRCVRTSNVNGWQVVESRSFRIHHVGQPTVAERLAPVCERTRQSLRARWLGETNNSAWSLKCDLFLYPSGKEFQRLTRFSAETWGFADLEVGDRKVWMRRLHLRTDDAARIDKLLVHELTHVVLADYFAEHQIPRWADEGIAVLSEPAERRTKLREWLNQEAKQGRLFSLQELTQQRSVPQDKRLGELFYAQSVALVEFLLTDRQLSESELLRFVADCEAHGLPTATRRQFPDSVADRWESDWREWMATPRVEVKVVETDRRNADPVSRPIVLVD